MWTKSAVGLTALPVIALVLQPNYAAMSLQSGATQGGRGGQGGTAIATLIKLPSLGSNVEVYGINEAGTVIVGQAFDSSGLVRAVKWTLQNGSWTITTLPYPGTAARARGIDNTGNIAGYDARWPRYPLLWPSSGGYSVLGCAGAPGLAEDLTADAQVVVGQEAGRAVVWRAPGYCAEFLDALYPQGTGSAMAINGDGTIIGGRISPGPKLPSVPARWMGATGQWQVQQLDSRSGGVESGNAAGDLVGSVTIPCALDGGCQRAFIWYASGSSHELGTLAGGEHSWGQDINSAEEVVGLSIANGAPTPFIWSSSLGMLKLPVNGSGYAAAVSDVRSDGTRVVAGMNNQHSPVIWVVR